MGFELNDARRSRSRSRSNYRSPQKQSSPGEIDGPTQGSAASLKALAGAGASLTLGRDLGADKDLEMLETIESNIVVATWIDNLGMKAKDQSVSALKLFCFNQNAFFRKNSCFSTMSRFSTSRMCSAIFRKTTEACSPNGIQG